jgi:hypothetical protein
MPTDVLERRSDHLERSPFGISPTLARTVLPLLPTVPILGLWIYLAPNSGGYFPKEWYPATILLVAVALMVGMATGRVLPAARGARTALLLLAGYVGWAYASLLWADSTGSAWESANKMLLFLAAAWALSLLPWTATSAKWLFGAWALGIAVVAAFSLMGAVGTHHLSNYLFEIRYQHPVGYANGNAALGALGALVAFGISSDRDLHPALSGLFLAAAALLADFTMLAQSRASVIGGAVALVVFMAYAPDRLRIGVRLVALAGSVALAAGTLLDVYSTGEAGGRIGPALDDAVAAVWPSALVAGVLGVALALAERGVRRNEGLHRAARRGTAALAVLAALGVVALAVANSGRISDTLHTQWTTLTGGEYSSVEGARVSNLDPYERPDYWRVAIDLFQENPVAGIGTGNFEREYTARRHEAKHSRYVHNMFLRALGEGGFVGAALLVGFFLTLFAAGAMLRRRLERGPALVLATALAAAAYFAVHLNFDWLEEIPAVASPAFALPIVALVAASGAVAGGAVKIDRAPEGGRRRIGAAVAVGVVGLVALVSLVPPYLSVRYSNRAQEVGAANLPAAFDDLDRARSLNPVSLEPDLAEGRIAIAARDYPAARKAFQHSLTVEDNWLAHYELALLSTGEGHFRAGARELALARAMNARDPVLTQLNRDIKKRKKVDSMEENRTIQRDAHARFTTSGR